MAINPEVAETANVAGVAYKPPRSLAALVLRNLGLTIITLGIYRFWAKNAVRRFLWASVRINGEAFEYTGRGIELFIGFLIVIGLFIAIGVVDGVIKYIALESPTTLAIVQTTYLVLLMLLFQIAMFRARRYRLSRTYWRAIRCGQDGSTWRYLGLSVGWGILSLLTLGLIVPYMRTALERYKMVNTRFGTQYFTFAASGSRLMLRWLLYFAVVVVTAAAVVWLNRQNFVAAFVPVIQSPTPAESAARAADVSKIAGSFGLWAVIAFLGFIWYRVAEFRYFTSSAKLGEIGFRSDAGGGRVAWMIIRYMLGLLLMVVVVFGVFVGGAVLFRSALITLAPTTRNIYAGTGGVVLLLALLPALSVTIWVWLRIPVLKYLCRTLTITNFAAVDSIAQSTAPVPKYGEGLADSFDIGAI